VIAADVAEALALSSLGSLAPAVIEQLTQRSFTRDIKAGTVIHRDGEPPFCDLVVSGLFRAYVAAPSGRTMTIRYGRRGALMGTGTLFNPGVQARGSVSALVDSRLLRFDPIVIRTAANKHVQVTAALLREASARVADYINELEASAMASVRQRLARHLLDLAAERQAGSLLRATANQEDLAGAVGTVREIVVRILRDMRDAGLVRTGRGHVDLLDPVRLEAETFSRQRERGIVEPKSLNR
jgi:CRP/FNR family transcriptional regulator, cyclic AMP receptor protein